jgi:tetratricopeptide (TPR) repeat protein
MSHDRRLNSFLLMKVLEGRKAAMDPHRVAPSHLRVLYPCLAEGEPVEGDDAYDVAIARAVARTGEVQRRMVDERAAAEADLAFLRSLPGDERPLALEESGTRFRGPLLVDLLVQESHAEAHHDSGAAYDWADLAERVARRLPETLYGAAHPARLAIRAAAYRANALRVAGELRGADALWTEIASRLRDWPLGDAAGEAELASLEASLRADQKRLDEADRLLRRAVHRFRLTGDVLGLTQVRIQRAKVLKLRGEPAAAADLLRDVARGLDHETAPVLSLITQNNLALCLCDLGEFAAAAEVVERNRDFYRQAADARVLARMEWIEGRIARGLGHNADAEERLSVARRRFIDLCDGFNAAMVCLDLAELFLGEGRTHEVRRLAEEMAPVFAAQDLHREALQALLLFQRAAVAERVTVEVVVRLRAYLEGARRDPRLRFSETD